MNRCLITTILLVYATTVIGESRLADPPPALAFTMKTLDGTSRNLSDYYGKPVLVVNVASKCGLTPQYKGLQALHETYGPKGLQIVGFPCNDFRKQEPGTHAEIQSFCQKNYGVEFDLMEKVSVAPGSRHPFYENLIKEAGGPDTIRWNFEKFLLDRHGKVTGRFAPRTSPNDKTLVAAIEKHLAEPAPIPLAYSYYLGRRVAHTMHWKGAAWLLRTEREREEATTLMLEELRLKPGMSVADVGCGNGFHVLPIARAVAPGGKVFGSDIQPEMLTMLKDRAAKAGIANVSTVNGTYVSPKLPENSVDLVLLVDAYHEFSHPPQMLAEIRKSLKVDGQVVLVEFRAEDPEVPIKPDHKMSQLQVLKELKANGFELARSFDKLPWQHMMFFTKTK